MSACPELILADILPQLTPEDTAFIVHDLDAVTERRSLLESAFPSSVHHAVAIKTMPHPRVLEHLARSGLGLEAASLEEVRLGAAAGINPGRLIFDSPVKTQHEIDLCSSLYPGMLMNANSIAELERYAWDDSVRVGLRINPLVDANADANFDVTAPASKFGVSIDRREAILSAAMEYDFTALHMHIGSGLSDAAAHLAAAQILVSLAEQINESRGDGQPPISLLDIGGGLAPEPLGADTTMARLAKRLTEDCPALLEYEVWTEFGQWVHADAGWAAAKIEYLDDRETPMAFTHLGADYLLRLVYGHHPGHAYSVFTADGRPRTGPECGYDLAGPLCFAGDVIGQRVTLPTLEVGDWLVLENTGANTYGLWSRHCSRDLPSMFGVERGRVSRWNPRRSVAS